MKIVKVDRKTWSSLFENLRKSDVIWRTHIDDYYNDELIVENLIIFKCED